MSCPNPLYEEHKLDLDDALDEMVSAEEFLNYFSVPFEQSIVHVNRLHIMQRFHDYLSKIPEKINSADDEIRFELYRHWLTQAYQDFVHSDALTEKVFKVFHMNEAQTAFVSIDDLIK